MQAMATIAEYHHFRTHVQDDSASPVVVIAFVCDDGECRLSHQEGGGLGAVMGLSLGQDEI